MPTMCETPIKFDNRPPVKVKINPKLLEIPRADEIPNPVLRVDEMVATTEQKLISALRVLFAELSLKGIAIQYRNRFDWSLIIKDKKLIIIGTYHYNLKNKMVFMWNAPWKSYGQYSSYVMQMTETLGILLNCDYWPLVMFPAEDKSTTEFHMCFQFALEEFTPSMLDTIGTLAFEHDLLALYCHEHGNLVLRNPYLHELLKVDYKCEYDYLLANNLMKTQLQ
jgi:hypothetical protein